MNEPRMKDEGVWMNVPNATNTNAMDAALDRRVARALERAPGVEIPAGFASRVAGQLPVRRAVAVTPARYGFIAMRTCVAALLAALVVLAMRAADRTAIGVTLEWILCAQFIALAIWLAGVRSFSASEA